MYGIVGIGSEFREFCYALGMFFPKPSIPEAYYTHPSQVADAYATLADPMKRQKYESWMKVGFC